MNKVFLKYILRSATAAALLVGLYFVIQPLEKPGENSEAKEDGKYNFVKPVDFEKHYEQFVIFDGTIIQASRAKKVLFLKIGTAFKTELTLVLFEKYYPIFPEEPEKYYLNQSVRITGFLKKYKGKAEVILYNPKQIEIKE